MADGSARLRSLSSYFVLPLVSTREEVADRIKRASKDPADADRWTEQNLQYRGISELLEVTLVS
jgi:hypothetical protein